MFDFFNKTRKIIKERKQFLKKIKEFVVIDYMQLELPLYPSNSYVAMEMNGLNDRKFDIAKWFERFNIGTIIVGIFKTDMRVAKFMNKLNVSPEKYWETVTFEKPYWFDHYMKTLRIYDEEFERLHTLKCLAIL